MFGLAVGCSGPTQPSGVVATAPSTETRTPDGNHRPDEDAIRDLIARHPLFQRSAWVKKGGAERPDAEIPLNPPLGVEDVTEELTLNGATLIENRLTGQVTGVNLSHGDPKRPKKLVNAGLALLKHLPQLRQVGLYNSAVSDAGLRHLSALGDLTEIELGWTEVGDDGLRHLKGLTKLQVLGLSNTRVTDAGVEQLRGMSHLRVLSLSETAVTDAAVETLAGLAELTDLRLDGTKLSQEGLDRLAKALPKCEIRFK